MIQEEIAGSGRTLGCRGLARRLLSKHGISVGRHVLWADFIIPTIIIFYYYYYYYY